MQKEGEKEGEREKVAKKKHRTHIFSYSSSFFHVVYFLYGKSFLRQWKVLFLDFGVDIFQLIKFILSYQLQVNGIKIAKVKK